MKHSRNLKALVLALLIVGGEASAQDILQMFLPGGPEHRMIGGNPFSPRRSEDDRGRLLTPLLRYDGRIDEYYGEVRTDGTAPGLGGRLHSLSLRLPLNSGAEFGLAAQSRVLLSQARNTSDQLLNYDNSVKVVRLSYDTPLSASTRWNVSLGHTNASGALLQDVGTAITFHAPIGSLDLNVERTANSQELDIAVAGVRGLLPLDHQSTEVRLQLETGTANVRVVVGGFRKALSPIPGTVRRNILQFSPGGFMWGWETLIETPVGTAWKGMASLSGLSFNGAGSFSANGSRYGLLRNAEYRSISGVAALMTTGESGSMFVADIQYTVVDGSISGYAESWPFISGLQSLFSARGNFQLEGAFRLARIHAGGTLPVASWLGLGGGITAMRMDPALRIESWQPGIFGVGRAGYSDRRLSITRIDGAMFSGGLRVEAGRIRMDYSVSQFVPIMLVKGAPANGTKDIFTPAQPGSVVRSWGGLFQSLSVEVEI